MIVIQNIKVSSGFSLRQRFLIRPPANFKETDDLLTQTIKDGQRVNDGKIQRMPDGLREPLPLRFQVAGPPINKRRAAILYRIWMAEGGADRYRKRGLTIKELKADLSQEYPDLTEDSIRTHVNRLYERKPPVLGTPTDDVAREYDAGNTPQRYPLVTANKIIRRKLTARMLLKALDVTTRNEKQLFIAQCVAEFGLPKDDPPNLLPDKPKTSVMFRVSQLISMHYLKEERRDDGTFDILGDTRSDAELLFIEHISEHPNPTERFL